MKLNLWVQTRGPADPPPLSSSTSFTVTLIWRRRWRGRRGGVTRWIGRNAGALVEVNTIRNCCYFRAFSLHQQHIREMLFIFLCIQCTHMYVHIEAYHDIRAYIHSHTMWVVSTGWEGEQYMQTHDCCLTAHNTGLTNLQERAFMWDYYCKG